MLVKQLAKAKHINKTLGTKVAAKYMANRDWSIDAALWVLLKTTVRK